MDGWLSEWMGDWVNGWVTEWMDGWLSEWMGDWVNGWLSEWMGDWIDMSTHFSGLSWQASAIFKDSVCFLFLEVSWQIKFRFDKFDGHRPYTDKLVCFIRETIIVPTILNINWCLKSIFESTFIIPYGVGYSGELWWRSYVSIIMFPTRRVWPVFLYDRCPVKCFLLPRTVL